LLSRVRCVRSTITVKARENRSNFLSPDARAFPLGLKKADTQHFEAVPQKKILTGPGVVHIEKKKERVALTRVFLALPKDLHTVKDRAMRWAREAKEAQDSEKRKDFLGCLRRHSP